MVGLLSMSVLHAENQASKSWIETSASMAQRVKRYLENSLVAGCDSAYVQSFETPWLLRASLISYGTRLDTKMHEGKCASLSSKPQVSLELGISYRDMGISYSHQVSSTSDQDFTFSSYSPRWGGEIRWHRSTTLNGQVMSDSSYIASLSDYPFEVVDGDIRQQSFMVNGYYIFNYRHFSYPAAMSGSVRQVMSCGSPLVCLSYYHSKVSVLNYELPDYWDDIRGIRINQLAVGGGYAYNWVFGPDGNMLAHVSVMPMLALLHFNKVTTRSDSFDIEEDFGFNQTAQQNTSGFGRNTDIRFTGVVRASFQYTWAEHMVTGIYLLYNRHDIGSSRNLRITSDDWSSNMFIGYRF